jgi:hypothetical protein
VTDSQSSLSGLIARALQRQGQTDAALEVIDEQRRKQAKILGSRSTDLGFVADYVETRRLRITLDAASKRGAISEETRTACKEIDDAVVKIAPAVRVHQQITQAWVEAQSCLGQGEREDVKRAVAWLQRDRSAESSP